MVYFLLCLIESKFLINTLFQSRNDNHNMKKFTLNDMPSQQGKIAIVTGANNGIGYETALGLANKGATVIMACRNPTKAQNAISRIKEELPKADLIFIPLDLSSLKSVRDFADTFKSSYQKLDILVNNAGIMIPPFSKTEDGFESQMGVNYFAHFLLTGLLMNELNASAQARVVALSSVVHKMGKISFSNLNAEKRYSKVEAYSQSKLACMMFAYELDRRLKKANSSVISVVAHPGVSATSLLQYIPKIVTTILLPLTSPIMNTPKQAAMPSLMAALDTSVKGGDFFGPTGFGDMSGEPAKVASKPHSHNKEIAEKLWETSEELLSFKFEV